MKRIDWNKEKNLILIESRKISFEVVAEIITNDDIVAMIDHPNQSRYPNQKIYFLNIGNYIYMVPYVEDEDKIFLKTIIPSNKATRDYLLNKNNK